MMPQDVPVDSSPMSQARQESEQTDLAAFDEIYCMYKEAVFSFAYYLTRDRGEAEDLYQETWLRIARRGLSGINRDSLKTWIFTVVSNLYKDSLRKKRIRRLFLIRIGRLGETGDFGTEIFGGRPQETPGDSGLADLGQDIAEALARLPERQRRVFVLKEIAGFEQAEVSQILGLPLGTVKSLMHRAVRRLRKSLADYSPKKEGWRCNAKTLSV